MGNKAASLAIFMGAVTFQPYENPYLYRPPSYFCHLPHGQTRLERGLQSQPHEGKGR